MVGISSDGAQAKQGLSMERCVRAVNSSAGLVVDSRLLIADQTVRVWNVKPGTDGWN